MPTPHYGLSPVNRGSTRKGVVRPACGGGSAAARATYIDRGGEYAARAADVLARGHVGPDLGDWAVADRWERRKDAVVAREIIAAVPHCLTLTQQIAVAQEHAEYLRRVHGVAVKWALHRAGDGDHRNTHIHFLLTTRKVSDDGRPSETKIKSLDRKTGGRDAVAAMRGAWQDSVNAALAASGRSDWLDLRTLAAQGIEREAQQRVPTAEYIRARRGEIRSKQYERNQRLAALKAATDACAENAAELTAARRVERRERVDRAVKQSQRVAARARRRVASSRRVVAEATRSQRASADYRRGASAALDQRCGRKRAGPPAVRTKLLRADVDHVDHEGHERGSHERHPARISGDGLAGRSHRRDDAPDGDPGERAEVRVTTKGPIAVALAAAVPSAEAKIGFFQRVWRRLTGAAPKKSDPAAPPLVQIKTEMLARITETQKETEAKPPPSKPPVVAPVPVSARLDGITVTEVFKIETPKGSVFFVRRVDWNNRADQTDVPLCDAAGQVVQTGQRARLRVSTILTCNLVPVDIPTSARVNTTADVSQYLPSAADVSPENLTM